MFSSLIPQDVLDFQRVSWLHSSKYVSGEVLDGSDKKVVVQGFVPNLVVFGIEIKSDMWSELLQVFRQWALAVSFSIPDAQVPKHAGETF